MSINPTLKSTMENARSRYSSGSYSQGRPLTIDHVVMASLGLLSVVAVVAVGTVFTGLFISAPLASMASVIGCGGVIVMGLFSLFSTKVQEGSAIYSLILAVFEGLMVGGLTFFVGSSTVAGVSSWVLVGQSLVATTGLFFAAMFMYYMKIIRPTQKFDSILKMSIAGMGVFFLINFVVTLVTGYNFLFSDGPIPIIIGIVSVILASLSLISTFGAFDEMTAARVDSKYKWSLGLSFVLSLIWLYTEILRLLYLFNRD